jgi:hypothetical protein
MVMMLAFVVDQTQQLGCALFQAVWATLGSKRLRWERMRALFYDYALESMRQLLEALLYGLKKSNPIFAVDSSSSLHRFPGRLRAIEPSDTSSLWGSYGSMTRCVGFQQDLLSCLIAKVSSKDGNGGSKHCKNCPPPSSHRTHRS